MTHSFGEYRNDGAESHLSQILEDSPHPKYCLSKKACIGILNRAKRRGKELPKELEVALMRQAGLIACKEMGSTEQTQLDATEEVGEKM